MSEPLKYPEDCSDDFTAYELDPGDNVGCCVCMQSSSTANNQFTRGEAYLVPPGHYSVNANYVCRAHLSPKFIIVDVSNLKF